MSYLCTRLGDETV